MGTHTSDNEQNYLQIAQVQLPNDGPASAEAEQDLKQGGYGQSDCKISITQKIIHDGEINRAR